MPSAATTLALSGCSRAATAGFNVTAHPVVRHTGSIWRIFACGSTAWPALTDTRPVRRHAPNQDLLDPTRGVSSKTRKPDVGIRDGAIELGRAPCGSIVAIHDSRRRS